LIFEDIFLLSFELCWEQIQENSRIRESVSLMLVLIHCYSVVPVLDSILGTDKFSLVYPFDFERMSAFIL